MLAVDTVVRLAMVVGLHLLDVVTAQVLVPSGAANVYCPSVCRKSGRRKGRQQSVAFFCVAVVMRLLLLHSRDSFLRLKWERVGVRR